MEYTPESAFQYSNSSAGVVITKYVGNYLDVVIPPYLGGLPVVEIGSDSFSDATVRSVKLPEGVAKISDRAFFFCQAMDSINLPESLQIIGGNAFYGCLSLTRLYIPANVISIDCLTFGWTSLREINVASGNSHYASRDGVLYNGSMTTLIFYPPNRPGQEFTLPDTVTEIGFYAIDRPVNLKKLILNSSLREFSVGRITGSIADISAKNNRTSATSTACYSRRTGQSSSRILPAGMGLPTPFRTGPPPSGPTPSPTRAGYRCSTCRTAWRASPRTA